MKMHPFSTVLLIFAKYFLYLLTDTKVFLSFKTNWLTAQRECNKRNGNMPLPRSKDELLNWYENMRHKDIASFWLPLRKESFPETRWLDGSVSEKYNCEYLLKMRNIAGQIYLIQQKEGN